MDNTTKIIIESINIWTEGMMDKVKCSSARSTLYTVQKKLMKFQSMLSRCKDQKCKDNINKYIMATKVKIKDRQNKVKAICK